MLSNSDVDSNSLSDSEAATLADSDAAALSSLLSSVDRLSDFDLDSLREALRLRFSDAWLSALLVDSAALAEIDSLIDLEVASDSLFFTEYDSD